MKLRLNNHGYSVDWKELIAIPFQVGKLEEPLNNNSYFFGLYNDSEMFLLLKKYDVSEELKCYINNEIIYIIIQSEKNHYVIVMTDSDFKPFLEEINKNKKILFAILDKENEVETFYIYDVT